MHDVWGKPSVYLGIFSNIPEQSAESYAVALDGRGIQKYPAYLTLKDPS